jgi:anti-anti-sigma regulatory factor
MGRPQSVDNAMFVPSGMGNNPSVVQLAPELDEVEAQLGNDVCVIRLAGSVGRSSVGRVRTLIERISAAPCSTVIIDASLLNSVDDEFVAALRKLSLVMQQWGKRINIYGATGAAAIALGPIVQR